MYTLLSKIDEAMADLEQVINVGDDEKFSKVCFSANISFHILLST